VLVDLLLIFSTTRSVLSRKSFENMVYECFSDVINSRTCADAVTSVHCAGLVNTGYTEEVHFMEESL